ncbi:MAG: hypothetical protein KDJ88_17295 [Bauldia sp.]|nr:hypothetical protein [Bauldia sp.]
MKIVSLAAAALFLAASMAAAQSHDGMNHDQMDHAAMSPHPADVMDTADGSGPTEGGQAAFAAIQEIVSILLADPATDWSQVDIEALRQHLIDMDNVTLRAEVTTEAIDGGARFLATSDDPVVTASIRRMTFAHVATMNGVEGWTLEAEEIPGGAALIATGDAAKIRALGYIGLMTVGAHHQAHHLALARGMQPH